jgi:hypothetical protein
MECAVCKQSVQDFKLIVNPKANAALAAAGASSIDRSVYTTLNLQLDRKDTMTGESFFDPIFSSPSSSNTAEGPGILPENDSFGDLESSFEFGIDFSLNEFRASTPKLENSMSPDNSALLPGAAQPNSKDGVVLRIDNVPWVCLFFTDQSPLFTCLFRILPRLRLLLGCNNRLNASTSYLTAKARLSVTLTSRLRINKSPVLFCVERLWARMAERRKGVVSLVAVAVPEA